MIRVTDGEITREYPSVSNLVFATDDFPMLCTFTLDGEFAFVFCKRPRPFDGTVKYLEEHPCGKVENIRFWA